MSIYKQILFLIKNEGYWEKLLQCMLESKIITRNFFIFFLNYDSYNFII